MISVLLPAFIYFLQLNPLQTLPVFKDRELVLYDRWVPDAILLTFTSIKRLINYLTYTNIIAMIDTS